MGKRRRRGRRRRRPKKAPDAPAQPQESMADGDGPDNVEAVERSTDEDEKGEAETSERARSEDKSTNVQPCEVEDEETDARLPDTGGEDGGDCCHGQDCCKTKKVKMKRFTLPCGFTGKFPEGTKIITIDFGLDRMELPPWMMRTPSGSIIRNPQYDADVGEGDSNAAPRPPPRPRGRFATMEELTRAMELAKLKEASQKPQSDEYETVDEDLPPREPRVVLTVEGPPPDLALGGPGHGDQFPASANPKDVRTYYEVLEEPVLPRRRRKRKKPKPIEDAPRLRPIEYTEHSYLRHPPLVRRTRERRMKVYWFPADFNQVSINGRYEPSGRRGSNACTIICVLVASKLSSHSHPMNIDRLPTYLPRVVLTSYAQCISEGNAIHLDRLTRGQLLHINLTVPESLVAGLPSTELMAEWYYVQKDLAPGVSLQEGLFEEITTAIRRWLNRIPPFPTAVPQAGDLYMVIITQARSVLIVYREEYEEITLLDSHTHGRSGAVIAQTSAPLVRSLCSWYEEVCHTIFGSNPVCFEISCIYAPRTFSRP